jgi:hypothetical protein
MYSLLPMSAVVDYDFGLFCVMVLRGGGLKFIDEHTLRYRPAFPPSESHAGRPGSHEEFASWCASWYKTDQAMEYTVPFSVWEEMCRDQTHLNRIFRKATRDQNPISPVFLRLHCTNCLAIDRGLFMKSVVWKNVEKNCQAALTDYLERAPAIVLLFFIEWITGEWGIAALRNAECPGLFVCGSTGNERVVVHARGKALEIGKFRRPDDMIRKVKRLLQQFLNRQYN